MQYWGQYSAGGHAGPTVACRSYVHCSGLVANYPQPLVVHKLCLCGKLQGLSTRDARVGQRMSLGSWSRTSRLTCWPVRHQPTQMRHHSLRPRHDITLTVDSRIERRPVCPLGFIHRQAGIAAKVAYCEPGLSGWLGCAVIVMPPVGGCWGSFCCAAVDLDGARKLIKSLTFALLGDVGMDIASDR